MKLIGITGKLGSGKDFITNNVIIPSIKNSYRYLQCAFADQLKVNVMTKNYINYHSIYEQKTPETRMFLQREGTEIGRNLNPNIWIDYLNNWITVHHHRGGVELFIVSDVRFKNEFDYIKNKGGIILKVVAPQRNIKRLKEESKGLEDNTPEGGVERSDTRTGGARPTEQSDTYQYISTHPSECDLDDLDDSNYDMVINNDPSFDFNLDKLQEQFKTILNNHNKKMQFRQIDLDQVM